MPARTLDTGSPRWWLDRLDRALTARESRLRTYHDYYDGEHPLAFSTEKFRAAFGNLFDEFADNWCELVIDAVEERLNVSGFRLSPDDARGDRRAWRIWQRNQLDADSQIAHTEALIGEQSYALVWNDPEATADQARIWIESPFEMIVEPDPGDRRRRAAALKRWDDGSTVFATLYLPDGIFKYRATSRSVASIRRTDWTEREIDNEEWPLANPLRVVPVVPIVNRPRLLRPGVSELKSVIPNQDAVNKLVADLLVAAEFGAFRQRWATGLEIPRDEKGNRIEPFRAAVDRLWATEAADTKFGEFGETNLANLVAAIENRIQSIASQTRTPPHYFYLRGEFPSGESIKSAETGLVAKARRKMRHFGEAWEEVIRLAFAVEGIEAPEAEMAETIWADPESRTEGEHIDAVLKRGALGVPQEQLWEDAGYSPTQIERFKAQQREQALLGDALADAVARFNADLEPSPNGGVPAAV